MPLHDSQIGDQKARGQEPLLLGPDGRALELADTMDCKIQLRQLFQAEALRLSLGKPAVAGGCPGACPSDERN